MSFRLLAPALLLCAACAPAPAVQPQPVHAAAEEVTFILRQGAAAVITERSRRVDDRLEAELTITGGPRVAFEARLLSDASVSRIAVRQFAAGTPAAGAPAMESTATFEGGTVRLTMTQGETTETLEREAVPGSVVFINPSPALMEQIVRRARAMGVERAEVPIWIAAEGGQNAVAVVEFTAADAARLTLGDTEIVIQTDARGRLLGGSVPAQALTIERRTPDQP